MKYLEEENRRLRKMYTEFSLKHEVAKEALKKVVRPAQRRQFPHLLKQKLSASNGLAD